MEWVIQWNQFQSFIEEYTTKVQILQKQLEYKEISLHNAVGKHNLQQPWILTGL